MMNVYDILVEGETYGAVVENVATNSYKAILPWKIYFFHSLEETTSFLWDLGLDIGF